MNENYSKLSPKTLKCLKAKKVVISVCTHANGGKSQVQVALLSYLLIFI